jgi:uncharacterized damage-inducible protein DinB
MHPRILELTNYLDDTRRALRAALDGVEDAILEAPPAAGQWSADEVVDHLRRIEETVLQRIEEVRNSPFLSVPDPETTSIMGSLDRYRIPTVVRPLNAPEWTIPRKGVRIADARRELERAREKLMTFVHQFDGMSLDAVTAPHPRMGDLTLYEWLLFVGQHEERHLVQIRKAISQVSLR